MHELHALVDVPFVLLSPVPPPWAEFPHFPPSSWHWFPAAVGLLQSEITWYSYSDSRFDGCFPPSCWPPTHANLQIRDSFPFHQSTLDQIVSKIQVIHPGLLSSASGWLLLEDHDPISALMGAMDTLSSLTLIAFRKPSRSTPESVELLDSLLLQISKDDLVVLADEWMCFTDHSLRDLISVLRIRFQYGHSLERAAVPDHQGRVLLAEPYHSLLYSALRSCISADWLALTRLQQSLSTSVLADSPSFNRFFSALAAASSLCFTPVCQGPVRSSEILPSDSLHYIQAAFSLLKRFDLASSCYGDSGSRDAGRRFAQLLITAASVEGFALSDSERDQLLLMSSDFGHRYTAQMNLSQLIEARRLPDRMVFIVGMHRSGTSALAGLLHRVGFAMPQTDLIPATEGNPRGHWESKVLYQNNNRLLKELGSSWQQATNFPPGLSDSEPCCQWRQQMLEFFANSLQVDSAVILKDPRFSLLGFAMAPWLTSGIFDPVFLMCLRHPAEVAHSLWKRDEMPTIKACRLWISYVLSAQKLCRNQVHRIILYDHLVDNTLDVLSGCVQLITTSLEFAQNYDFAVSSVEPALRHWNAADLMPDFTESLHEYPTELSLSLRLFSLLAESTTISSQLSLEIDMLAMEWEIHMSAIEPGQPIALGSTTP